MNRRYITLVGALLLVSIVGFVVYSMFSQKPEKNVVIIDGITDCSHNIKGAIVDGIQSDLYAAVKKANEYNKVDTAELYHGSIRSGTCKTAEPNTVPAVDDEEQTIQSSSAIVDIPDAKQSWQISYNWVFKNEAIRTDLGHLRYSCVADTELKYGDFKCVNIISLEQYGTDKYDPILPYMPYSGEGFDLVFDPETKHVTATFEESASQQDNQALAENDKAIIPYWFEKRGLDINKYTIEYKFVYN
ncbi:hypothetical protein KDA14_02400 [Candidatus Saccharibacteria bacterium]|nr:hypothetical protein [Candidatus Saccharibacteria bacterium]